MPYPSRTPAIAYSLVNALSRITCGYAASSPSIENSSGFSTKSKKHSSNTTVQSSVPARRITRSVSSRESRFPVGLFGLQRKTMSISSVICSAKSMGSAKPSASAVCSYWISHPTVSNACAYSAKVGAGSSAFLGFKAVTAAKITSAAPFPKKIHAPGTCSFADNASRNRLHCTSG